jgi:hypothetical protein
MRTSHFQTVEAEQNDINTEAAQVAASLIRDMAAELCEAWKTAAAYSEDVGDGMHDRFYERAYLFDADRNEPPALTVRPASEWAEEFGGMDGPCATNPEDCPLELVTRKEFWRHHSNTNSA